MTEPEIQGGPMFSMHMGSGCGYGNTLGGDVPIEGDAYDGPEMEGCDSYRLT